MEKGFKNGFTLIEMIVTLIIIGILAAISVPVIRHLLIENRIKSAAETFSQSVRLARSEAISRQQDIYLILQTDSSWCYGIHTSSSCICSPSNTCSLGFDSVANHSGITVSSTGFSSGNIYFDSIRAIPSESSQVTFTADGKSITVKISRLGQIALCATNISGGYPSC